VDINYVENIIKKKYNLIFISVSSRSRKRRKEGYFALR